ncbi:MAG: DUF6311 domain-containing protein [Bryobacterales bacterium]|nr:DUF6311 domain-containing protein [Bryobacterales bacterium]
MHPLVAYLLAGALGLAVCLTIYDMAFVTGESPFWQAPHADQMQALTGWYGFAHDQWRFPVFEVKTLRYPVGANIVFTDSIPLMALLFKPFVPWLPADFHYFGWWIALCFVLQAMGAVAVLRAWGLEDRLALATAIVLALSMPAWLVRHNHLALCGHFLLLFAVALYVKTQRDSRIGRLAMAWCGLALASLLIHLYLLAMVLALLAAAVLQRAWACKAQLRAVWPKLAAIPLAAACAVLVAALLSGHFRGEAMKDPSGGYGTYSMNLLHPWYPQGLLRLPGPMPNLDATGGQYEGFNYLGAGVLLLILAAVGAGARQWHLILRRHAFLLATLLLLALFALSNRVYLGGNAVLEFGVPSVIEKPVEIFRSSGRFFWPVGYVLALGAVVLVARERQRRRWLAIALAAAALLQWIDAGAARAFPRNDIRRALPATLPPALWRPLIVRHDLVRSFPGFHCGPAENHRVSQELQILAARAGVPITTIFMARQVDDCTAERDLVDTLLPGPRELVVYFQPFQVEHTRNSFPDAEACRAFAHGIVCSRRFLERSLTVPGDASFSTEYFREIDSPSAPPSIELGRTVLITSDAASGAVLRSGWYPAEAEGAWMRGGISQLRFRIPAGGTGPLQFRFRAKAYLSAKHPRKALTVSANGERLATLPVDTWEPRERSVDIPEALIAPDGVLRIHLEIDPVSSPAGDGVSADRRELGIQLQQVEFSRAPVAPPGGTPPG